MISIILCCRNSDINQSLKSNIEKTIGIEYELIVIDNSLNNLSIFSAYNIGVKKAKFPFLCFMHDDILYHTKNWGKNVIKHLQDESVGLIGVAGGHYLPDVPASWWSTYCITAEYLQGYRTKNGDYSVKYKSSRKNYQDETIKSVQAVAVDGFWFCIPRRIFRIISFDDITFTGWHSYDLDICMQVLDAGFQIHIVNDILIEHFSGGNGNIDWLSDLEKFHKKWHIKLPVIRGVDLSETEIIDRKHLVEDIYLLQKEIIRLNNEIERNHNSKAYRLGKLILKPLSYIRNLNYIHRSICKR